MLQWEINKGIGRTVEFKGLKAQYLFYFAGGLLVDLILSIVLYFCGVSQWSCLIIALICGGGIVSWVFHLNKKYGTYGIMKKLANKSHPCYVKNSQSVRYLLRDSSIK